MLGVVSSFMRDFTFLICSLGSLSDCYSRDSALRTQDFKENSAFTCCFVRSSILPFGISNLQLKIKNNRFLPLIRGVQCNSAGK